jgi:uncharacterized membrane protein
MFELIGHFHPLLVHLPIGILLLAILFELLPSWKSYRSLKRSIATILSVGAFTAILSCITGYLLSRSGDYETGIVGWHQWMGIILTIYSLGYVWMRTRKEYKEYRKAFAFVLLILLMVTGHLGGSLTHGEGYLTAGLTTPSDVDLTKVNLEQAHYYDDLVKPILEERCYSCHGSSKQKGKLRLDAPEHILKGGKDGKVMVAGKADESEMINRMLLPSDDEDHMPPKEKPQPSAREIEILKLWIAAGADFNKSVVESKQLAALQKIISSEVTKSPADIPEKNVEAADATVMRSLIKLGTVILPVANGSNFLSANLINVTSLDSAITFLSQLNEQVVWLKIGGQPLTDNQLARLSALKNITRLSLDGTQITDEGLPNLKSMNALIYLNLNNTKVTATGISNLASLKQLQSVYLYGTSIKPDQIETIKKQLPATDFEIGNYVVPLIAFDTTEAKAPVNK